MLQTSDLYVNVILQGFFKKTQPSRTLMRLIVTFCEIVQVTGSARLDKIKKCP
jgi:hypothetical protein